MFEWAPTAHARTRDASTKRPCCFSLAVAPMTEIALRSYRTLNQKPAQRSWECAPSRTRGSLVRNSPGMCRFFKILLAGVLFVRQSHTWRGVLEPIPYISTSIAARALASCSSYASILYFSLRVKLRGFRSFRHLQTHNPEGLGHV